MRTVPIDMGSSAARVVLASIFLYTVSLIPSPSIAQDPSPKEFFPSDHAAGSSYNESPDEKRKRRRAPVKLPSVVKPKKGNRGLQANPDLRSKIDTLLEGVTPRSQKEEQDTLSVNAIEGIAGTPLRSVGAIISSADPVHFKKSVAEFLQTALDRKLPVSRVYLVGPPDMLKDRERLGGTPLFLRFVLQGAQVIPSLEAPAPYQVKLSPAWILDTEDGEIVLEAMGALGRHLNKDGEYIDRGLSENFSTKVEYEIDGEEREEGDES